MSDESAWWGRLESFLATVGASTPEDHKWVQEARWLMDNRPEPDDREGLVELADEAEAIRDAVHDAVETYLVEREGWSTSMVAEFLAFFNGYSGAPNLDTFPDRLRDRLQATEVGDGDEG